MHIISKTEVFFEGLAREIVEFAVQSGKLQIVVAIFG
jgi:hypothetical protein